MIFVMQNLSYFTENPYATKSPSGGMYTELRQNIDQSSTHNPLYGQNSGLFTTQNITQSTIPCTSTILQNPSGVMYTELPVIIQSLDLFTTHNSLEFPVTKSPSGGMYTELQPITQNISPSYTQNPSLTQNIGHSGTMHLHLQQNISPSTSHSPSLEGCLMKSINLR